MIVPVENFNLELPVLKSLELAGLDPAIDEVIVAEGRAPSRQRNQAVLASRGEWIVFLDADSQVPVDYFKKVERFYEKRPRVILGGPVLLTQEASEMEQLAQALFSCPWLMGRSASRYQSVGVARETDQAELILCHLVTPKGVWMELEGFDERLYPNEENEWMDRAEQKGIRLIHDPSLFVRRSQRDSYAALFRTFFRYGKGRGEQMMVSGQISWLHLIPALMFPLFILTFAVLGLGWGYSLFSGPVGIYVVAVMGTLFWKEIPWQNSFLGGMLAPLLMGAYGVGEIVGLYRGYLKRGKAWQAGDFEEISLHKVFGVE